LAKAVARVDFPAPISPEIPINTFSMEDASVVVVG
jgi:hypothetical protein